MRGLCDKGEVKEALNLHDKVVALGFRLDKITYGTLINGLSKIGETEAGIKLLRTIQGRSTVMYNIIIDSLLKEKHSKEAYDLYSEMVIKEISPDVCYL
ncbi:hypothetical protein VIGAN_09126400 [Vigna angularis var. angularis]|uniref:Pentacotripeptide-repeat region of PRORP domain-containing protein n=1 Tax=Vigna angularis var. angularis TaxID=157739 RepID=A0A0S3SY59_PHAAN|nr:hypothetical protein VIGAN_09126400 [Vigna angularis var. angularis]